ncbi:hypothetical protein MHU86_25085 [Fragilaria crotonensis]|nr:hypothetical protein MHU86_25085 [Fragilaria crotonensis]
MSEDRVRTSSRHQTDEHETQTDEHYDTTQHKIRIAHNPNELESTKTLATLRQLAHADPSAACRLGWFIEKRMQQYLVLCAGVEHEDEINPALLEFRSTRQQLEDGAFVFPACDFLKERLGRGVDQKGDSQPVAAAGSARAGRRGQPADTVTNPQQDLFRETRTTLGRCSSITSEVDRSRTCAAGGT